MIAGPAHHPTFRGKGLIARFAYSLPLSMVGRRTYRTDPDERQHPRGLPRPLTALLRIALPDRAACAAFDEQARRGACGVRAWLEPQLGEFGALGHIADWAGKLAGLTARHAAHFHLADRAGQSEPWAGECRPRRWSGRSGSRRTTSSRTRGGLRVDGRRPDGRPPQYILRWLAQRHQPGAPFTKRDLFRASQRRFRTANELNAPLALLVQHGYIRQQDPTPEATGEPGRKPSPTYEVNPAIVGKRVTEMTEPRPARRFCQFLSLNRGKIATTSTCRSHDGVGDVSEEELLGRKA